MTVDSSTVALPYALPPKNPHGERFSLVVLCGIFTAAVLAVGIFVYVSLKGHWFRPVVPTLMLVCWWIFMGMLVTRFRRSATGWWVDVDHVERTLADTATLVGYDEVTSLRLLPGGAILEAPGHPALSLPKPAAEALAQSNLIDHLLATIPRTIQSEGAWCVRARPWSGAWRVVGGLALLVGGLSSLASIPQAVKMITTGRRFFARGVVLTSSGLKTSLHDFTTIPWNDVIGTESDSDGLVIHARNGQKLRVSPYADNYVPLVAYLDRRLGEPGDETPTAELWPRFDDA